MAKGAVFLHSQFQFHDGGTGKKYFVVLNEPLAEEPYIVAKTTSKLHDKSFSIGCNPIPAVFYIPAKNEKSFPVNTLIQLSDLYEFSKEEILKGHLKDKTITFQDDLASVTVAQLINCIRKLKEDISEYHFKLITR